MNAATMMSPAPALRMVERRSMPRFEARGRILGQFESEKLPVRIRDLGLHGFAVELSMPIPTGEEKEIRFTSYDDWSTVLKARSVYSRPSCTADGLPCFVTGFTFLPQAGRDADTIVRYMLEKVTSVAFFGQ